MLEETKDTSSKASKNKQQIPNTDVNKTVLLAMSVGNSSGSLWRIPQELNSVKFVLQPKGETISLEKQ